MELQNIKNLIEKYFDGTTSIKEEKQLKAYFSSNNVAPELEKYRGLFSYFSTEQQTQTAQEIVIRPKTRFNFWIAASVVVAIGLGIVFFQPKEEDLGTFDDPEIALQETQKALRLVSENINKGKEKMGYLKEFENTKNTIFK